MDLFKEVITPRGHILYWVPKHATNSDRVLGMDLDWTLIRPIKGKIHPLDINDWQFLYQDKDKNSAIKEKLTEGYKFVIFTNQGGLLSKKFGKLGVEDFKKRFMHILERLKKQYDIEPSALLVSLYDDFNRKPSTGMWEFMENHLNGGINVNRTASLYVGDMAGRKGDHSASDLMFAMNLAVPFQVPEVFYKDPASNSSNKTTSLIKNILADDSIFNPSAEKSYKRISKVNRVTTDEIIANLEDGHKQTLIIFIGSPASGKSNWYSRNLKKIDSAARLKYLGIDTFKGTLIKFHKEIESHLKNGDNVAIDNTNGTLKTRDKISAIAKGVNSNIQVFAVHFSTDKKICLHQNALRTKMINACELNSITNCGSNVPAVAIYAYWKHFEPVDLNKECNIDLLYTIDFEPVFLDNGLDIDIRESAGDDISDSGRLLLTEKDFKMLL
jgi:bifunctional polynucleotide phosphatase/kinase